MQQRNHVEGLENRDIEVLKIILARLHYIRAIRQKSEGKNINPIFSLMKAKKIDELRTHLRTLLNALDTSDIEKKRFLKFYRETLHAFLLLLAKYSPKNDRNAEGQVECYFSREPIPENRRLLLGGNGYQIDINFGSNEGEKVAVYTYLCANREANGKMKYPVDNSQTEIAYLDQRARAIRTDSQDPEIPAISLLAEQIPSDTDCCNRMNDFIGNNYIAWSLLISSGLAIAGVVSYFGLYPAGFLDFSFEDKRETQHSITNMVVDIAILVGAATLGSFISTIIICGLLASISSLINCLHGCSKACCPRSFTSEASDFLTHLATSSSLAVKIDEIPIEEEKKADPASPLLANDALSEQEEKRNQRVQHQLRLLPPHTPSANDDLELDIRVAP